VFVETGTFHGDATLALSRYCSELYTIELSQHLYGKAKDRFKLIKHVAVIQGDSGTELKKVLTYINQRALFWLDGHYSAGETAKGTEVSPILAELGHIFNARDYHHVIVIDDARLFGTDPGYPTLEVLKAFVQSKCNSKIMIENDSICILPIE